MKPKLAPLMLSVSKALARPTVEWPRVERALARDAVPLSRLTDAAHGHLNQELWNVPIRRLKDRAVSSLTVLNWLHDQGLPLSTERATQMLSLTLRVARHADRLPVAHWCLDHGAGVRPGWPHGNDLSQAGLSGTVSCADLRSLMARGLDLDPMTASPLLTDLIDRPYDLAGYKSLYQWIQTLRTVGIQARPRADGLTPLMLWAYKIRHTQMKEHLTEAASTWIGMWFTLVDAGNSPAQQDHFDREYLSLRGHPDDGTQGPLMSAWEAVKDTALGPAILAETRRRELARRELSPQTRPRRRV